MSKSRPRQLDACHHDGQPHEWVEKPDRGSYSVHCARCMMCAPSLLGVLRRERELIEENASLRAEIELLGMKVKKLDGADEGEVEAMGLMLQSDAERESLEKSIRNLIAAIDRDGGQAQADASVADSIVRAEATAAMLHHRLEAITRERDDVVLEIEAAEKAADHRFFSWPLAKTIEDLRKLAEDRGAAVARVYASLRDPDPPDRFRQACSNFASQLFVIGMRLAERDEYRKLLEEAIQHLPTASEHASDEPAVRFGLRIRDLLDQSIGSTVTR